MEKVTGKLTVFFENPFWIGVFEHIENNRLSVCKVAFGAEPKDYDVNNFILKNYNNLRFSTEVKIDIKKEYHNPERLQREARKKVRK